MFSCKEKTNTRTLENGRYRAELKVTDSLNLSLNFEVISEIHFSHFNCDIHNTLVCTPCQPYVQSHIKGSGYINFNCQPS